MALVGLVTLGVASETQEGLSWVSMMWNGVERQYAAYTPEEVSHPQTLVLLLHGGGGNIAGVWSSEFGISWRSLADRHGFVVCLPEGRPDPDESDAHHWNDGRIETENPAVTSTEDDVGFILSILDRVREIGPDGESRVFVVGVSNGGMMAYRLAAEAGARFTAVAAVIANLPDPSECAAPLRPVPLLIMNGSSDPIMPPKGGCVTRSSCDRGRVMSTADTISFWVTSNLAEATPRVESLPDRVSEDASTVTVYRFDASPAGAPVVYYHVEGGGHNVPGPEPIGALRRLLAGAKNRDIDAATEIWSFFSSFEASEDRTE